MDRHRWDERYGADELLWGAEPNRTLVAEVAGLVPGKALDLGAGEGRNAVWLAERGWDVTAVDFAAAAVAKGEQMAAARGVRVSFMVADLLEYDPAPGGFDLTVVLYLHLPPAQRGRVLEAAARSLAPGGVALVLGHHVANLMHGHGGPQDASVLLDPEEVAAELPGLAVVTAGRVDRTVTTEDGPTVAIDALVRAERRVP
ncbi:MAG: class I SAM-dependent methyltransferase [Actinomycetota bacterium]